MGQRFSKHDNGRKQKHCCAPSRKEIVEIVYDDAEQTEFMGDVSDNKLLMILNEAEVSAWQSSVEQSDYAHRATPTNYVRSRKQKLIERTVQYDHPKCRSTCVSSVQSNTTERKVEENGFKQITDGKSVFVSQKSSDNRESPANLTASENTYVLSPHIDQITMELPDQTKKVTNEKGEIVELVHSSTSSITYTTFRNQLCEQSSQTANTGTCPSNSQMTKFEQEISESYRSQDKRRRLIRNTPNHCKTATSPLSVSVDTTLVDTASIPGRIEEVPSAQNLPISVTPIDNDVEKYSELGKHRLVIKEESNIVHDPGRSSIIDKEILSCAATDTRSGSLPTVSHSSQPDFRKLGSSAYRPWTLSGDEQPKMHPTIHLADLNPTKPCRDWRTDPRFTDSFEHELMSTLSGPSGTMTVTAYSPDGYKSRFKALTLITMKPEEKPSSATPASFASTIKSVGDIRGNGINLDESLYPGSDELTLVPDCLELMKHSCFIKAKRRFGLQVGDTNFIGGNRTRNRVLKLKRQRPKCNTPGPPTPSGRRSFRSIGSPIPPQPVHIYAYRFWVSCEPWIEKLFKNPLDRRIESIGRVSDCHIRLTRRRRRNTKGFRQQMVSIVAPSAAALEKCCKMFDDKFPCFYATAGLILSHDQLIRLSKMSSRTDKIKSRKHRCSSVNSIPTNQKNVMQYVTSEFSGNVSKYAKLKSHSPMTTCVFE
ncbi:hypothetical protein FGIG_01222 [Fasciola gigantica]|uniref:Uncharacterized protein n=1 Tax=Fasciola gigantica TaxID=46835 RepID=A0A504YWE0_FASGI|nr:hypothetical protein FGIG_01222 [Fasciola gigantica]